MLVAIVLLVCGPQLGEWIAIQIGLGALFQGLTTLRTSLCYRLRENVGELAL
jgi:hypothetical protein